MGITDVICGAVLAAVAIVFFVATLGFPHLSIALSPVVFPRFVTITLFLLSMLLVVRGLSKPRPAGAARGRAEAAASTVGLSFAARFLLLLASGLLYVVALEPLGYILVTPPFLAAVMLLFGDRKWYRIVAVAVLGTAVLYAVFRLVFRVPLPRSPIG